ncbi:MAG: hypothetical protein ACTSU9_03485 [Promethearchaeota archaeon]
MHRQRAAWDNPGVAQGKPRETKGNQGWSKHPGMPEYIVPGIREGNGQHE